MSIISGFVGLGDALADKAKDYFSTTQQSAPTIKPVNSSKFSFDFSGALNKLAQPFRQATDPRSAAGSQVILTAGDAVSKLIGAGADRVSEILRGNNTKPTQPSTSIMPTSAFTSGPNSLGDLFADISALKKESAPSLPVSSVAQDAAAASRNSVVLVAGASLILVFLSVSNSRAR